MNDLEDGIKNQGLGIMGEEDFTIFLKHRFLIIVILLMNIAI